MIKKLLLSIVYNGLPKGAGLRDRSRTAVLNSISFISVTILTIFTVVDIIDKEFVIAIFTGSTALFITLSIIVVGITKKISIGTTSVSYIAFILFSALIVTSGEERAGYFWLMLLPLVSIFFMGIYHGTIITFLFGLLSFYLIFYVPNSNGIPLNPDMGMRVIGGYIGVSLFTIAFEIVRRKAFNQLEETSADLVEKRKQTTMILNNVKQGIFLLNHNLEIQDERSTFFYELFGDIKPNQLFTDLIKGKMPQRDFVATKDYLELFFNKTVNPTLLKSINPIDKILMTFTVKDMASTQLWLEFDFERIVLEDGNIQILGLFRDITEQVTLEEQLQREESESLQNMENLFQIIHVNSELMDEFLKDTQDEITAINELLKVETDNTDNLINLIFQKIHSIKGNAMLLGLNSIANKLKDFEEFIKDLKNRDTTWRELLKLTVNLAELKHDINQIEELIDKIISFQKKVGDKVQNKKYIFEESLKNSIVKLGVEYNREVNIDISDYNIDVIPEKYRRLYKDSINQFIRNSFAHGFETREERIKKQKPPTGSINISLKKVNDKLEFVYRDDGHGLSINKIKKVAVDKKGYTNEQVENLSGSDAVKLIFSPGFSTSKSVDNLSGQGIGMSVIKSHVDSAGGKLNIKSSTGKFCEFRIMLHE